jgi:hypothetical protein
MEPVIYGGMIGLLIGLFVAVVAGAVGYALGRKCKQEERTPVDEDPRIEHLMRELDFVETRRVPRCYPTHSGSAMAILVALLAAWTAPASAQAGPLCISDADRDATLKAKHGEVLVGNAPGTMNHGTVPILIELWLGPTSMTIVMAVGSSPEGHNCILAAGGQWRWARPEPVPEIKVGDEP